MFSGLALASAADTAREKAKTARAAVKKQREMQASGISVLEKTR